MKQKHNHTYQELEAEEQIQRNLVIIASCLLLSTFLACVLSQIFRYVGF